ncbi:putative cyclin-dependent kinase F-2 [Phragmites australis]|uniref:putative cyclin-dependent kinase F-2 n=1 Tax=Phragmites australis TaxID=29695 RepID=UPI002D791B12|nr:putative cyclin-dependent kinase F-2 [Phragmites australis]
MAAPALTNGGVALAEEEEPPNSWPPAVEKRYERLEKVGKGMFGDVYRAWDRVDERVVAVKRLAGRTDDRFVQTGLRDFAREAMSLAACRGHPSVVELLATFADSSRSDGDCFVVTEYAGRMNLREYMKLRCDAGMPFREAEVREAMRQLLRGVKRAHKVGVLHRDIQPENVLVDDGTEDVIGQKKKKKRSKGIVYKICGFGMSEPAAQTEKDDYAMLASPSSYRAPELFLGSRDYDGRIDTWGLGCIMAELLAGTVNPLFVGEQVFTCMLNLVGAKGIVEWPGLERLATPDRAAKLREEGCRETGHLREVFPEEFLSQAGFEVLRGLLESNPERRLTAAAALRKPWFNRLPFGGCFMPCGEVSP